MKTLTVLCFIALTACDRKHLPSPIVIADPCNDFVSSPDGPKLVRRDGQLLVEIPFTPAAGYEEADLMEKAARHGPVVARVARTRREFIIQGPAASGGIAVYVDSVENAEAILRDLCYQGEEAKLAAP